MDIKDIDINNSKQLAEYTNQELAKGRTQADISQNDFKKSDAWLRMTLKRRGYEHNKKLNEYVLKSNTEPTGEPQKGEKAIKNINTPVQIEKATGEPKRGKGRPQIYNKDTEGKNIDKSKITFEIDNRLVKALKVKKALEGITLNNYIEQLLNENIEPKYFDMVDK